MEPAGLRIAMVTTFYPPYNFGGDGIYVERLAHALVRRGHHVEVIHDTDAYRMLAGTDPAPPAAGTGGVTVHRLASRLPALASLAVQQTGRPVAHGAKLRALLGHRFDAIHFHNVSLIGGPGVWSCGTGVKLHTAHEHWLVCPSHILWRDNREICDEKRCLTCVLRHGRPPQLWRATDLIASRAKEVDAFLMLSRSAMENHRRFGFRAPMTVVPSFLPDAPDLPPAPAAEPPYFLFVGRLEVIKGLQDAIPAFGPDAPAELRIAGTGAYEGELRRLAAGSPKVRFLGRQPMEALRGLYRGAIATLTPSRCYEVFPMVVLEAFREESPIVARDLGPYPEIVAATGGGLLFSTPEELRAALHRLAADPGLARAMGRKGRAGLDALWSERVAMEAYFGAIRAAAERRGLADTAARAAAAQEQEAAASASP